MVKKLNDDSKEYSYTLGLISIEPINWDMFKIAKSIVNPNISKNS